MEKHMTRKRWFAMITVLIVIVLMTTTYIVNAQTASKSDIALTYSGRLANSSGQPVADGSYDFTFTLYATEKDDQALWSETQFGVNIKSGKVNVTLGQNVPISKDISDRKELWLSVSVRGPQDDTFTLLNPRQNLTAPDSVSALTCPHSHFTDYWGGTNTAYGLEVDNSAGTGDGVRGYSGSTVYNYAGVYGVNDATTGYGTGIFGASLNGVGVYASSGNGDGLEATTGSTTKSAIYAHAINANGVWAISTNKQAVHGGSTNSIGVWGESTSSYGVQGYNNHDNSSTGNYGGYFTSNNYRGGFIGALQTASWYGAMIDGGLIVTNGNCVGCTLVYVGKNNGEDAVRPGDLIAVIGMEMDTATSQPIPLVRLASNANDPVIGIAVGETSAPGSQTGPDKIQSDQILHGQYVLIAVSGLVQARVADKTVAIGDRLSPGPAGANVAVDTDNSMVRVMSAPDDNGFVWVMVSGR
jgi:hypothetical protein